VTCNRHGMSSRRAWKPTCPMNVNIGLRKLPRSAARNQLSPPRQPLHPSSPPPRTPCHAIQRLYMLPYFVYWGAGWPAEATKGSSRKFSNCRDQSAVRDKFFVGRADTADKKWGTIQHDNGAHRSRETNDIFFLWRLQARSRINENRVGKHIGVILIAFSLAHAQAPAIVLRTSDIHLHPAQ